VAQCTIGSAASRFGATRRLARHQPLRFRLAIQLPPKGPDLLGCCRLIARPSGLRPRAGRSAARKRAPSVPLEAPNRYARDQNRKNTRRLLGKAPRPGREERLLTRKASAFVLSAIGESFLSAAIGRPPTSPRDHGRAREGCSRRAPLIRAAASRRLRLCAHVPLARRGRIRLKWPGERGAVRLSVPRRGQKSAPGPSLTGIRRPGG
jgi:hypothetical protein